MVKLLLPAAPRLTRFDATLVLLAAARAARSSLPSTFKPSSASSTLPAAATAASLLLHPDDQRIQTASFTCGSNSAQASSPPKRNSSCAPAPLTRPRCNTHSLSLSLGKRSFNLHPPLQIRLAHQQHSLRTNLPFDAAPIDSAALHPSLTFTRARAAT